VLSEAHANDSQISPLQHPPRLPKLAKRVRSGLLAGPFPNPARMGSWESLVKLAGWFQCCAGGAAVWQCSWRIGSAGRRSSKQNFYSLVSNPNVTLD